MTYNDVLNAPWSLEFERDGTEDLAIIRDAEGNILTTSREFWLPEDHDPTPPTLAAMQLMALAPELLIAAEKALGAMVLADEMTGQDSTARPQDGCPLQQLEAVVKQITKLID